MARPTRYSKQLADDILARLEDGDTLFQVADKVGVSRRTILHWSRDRDDFGERYRKALSLKAELCIHKSEEALRYASDRDGAFAAKVRVDGYLRLAARLDAGRWNDAHLLKIAGAEDAKPVAFALDPDAESPTDRIIRMHNEMYERVRAGSLLFAEMGDPPEIVPDVLKFHRQSRRRFIEHAAIEKAAEALPGADERLGKRRWSEEALQHAIDDERKEEEAREAYYAANPGARPMEQAQDHRRDENGPAGDRGAKPSPPSPEPPGEMMRASTTAVEDDAGGGTRPPHDPQRLRIISGGNRMARGNDIAAPGEGANAFDVKDEATAGQAPLSAPDWFK